MKKRFMSCLLATAMVITSLTACGGGKSTTTDTTAAAGGDAKETTAGEAAGIQRQRVVTERKLFSGIPIQVMRQPVLRMRLRLITRARISTL